MFYKKPSLRGIAARNTLVERHLALVPWAIFKMRPRLLREAKALGGRDAIQIGRMGMIRAAELWDERGRFSTYAILCIRWAIRREYQKLQRKSVSMEEFPLSRLLGAAASNADPLMGKLLSQVLNTLTFREREILKCRYGLFGGDAFSLQEMGAIFRITKERVRQTQMRAFLKLSNEVRISVLARGLGYQRCGLCADWSEWGADCPECKKTGCTVCIIKRCIRRDEPLTLCCCSCAKKLKSERPAAPKMPI